MSLSSCIADSQNVFHLVTSPLNFANDNLGNLGLYEVVEVNIPPTVLEIPLFTFWTVLVLTNVGPLGTLFSLEFCAILFVT